MSRLFTTLFATFALFVSGQAARADVVAADDIAAVAAAQAGDPGQAYDLVADDPLMSDLVTFLRLRRGGSPFEEYALFLVARPDWPDQDLLRARAEEMLPKGADKDSVLAWFQGHTPQTGQGAVRLAEALMQNGQPDLAKEQRDMEIEGVYKMR